MEDGYLAQILVPAGDGMITVGNVSEHRCFVFHVKVAVVVTRVVWNLT